MLGGSAAMNAMMVLRGHRADYDGWAAAGCPGWSWDDVEPAFARSAAGAFPLADLPDRHVLAEAFVHAAHGVGIPPAADLNGEDNEGAGLVPVSQRRGRRFSVLEGYYAPARRRPNLTVVTDALVTRVLVEDGRAVGVAFRPDGDEPEDEVRCSREVVLCAGAIGTPHLLQLSGIGPRGPLEAAGVEVVHEHPSVGANLLDHLANGLLVRTKGVETLASAESLPNLVRWALLGRGPLTSNLGEAVAFVRSRPDLKAPDLELLLAPVLFEEEGLKPPSEHGLTLAVVLLEPRSSGTVLLRSADPRVLPAIDPQYLTDPGGEDAATLLRGPAPRTPRARAGAARVARRRRDPAGRGRTIGRRAPRAHPRAVADPLPPGRNVSHGVGCRFGRGSAASRSRDRRAAHRRCVGHPEAAARPHELADRDDRRAGFGARRGGLARRLVDEPRAHESSVLDVEHPGARDRRRSRPVERHTRARDEVDDLEDDVAVRAARDRTGFAARESRSSTAGSPPAPSASSSVVSIGSSSASASGSRVCRQRTNGLDTSRTTGSSPSRAAIASASRRPRFVSGRR